MKKFQKRPGEKNVSWLAKNLKNVNKTLKMKAQQKIRNKYILFDIHLLLNVCRIKQHHQSLDDVATCNEISGKKIFIKQNVFVTNLLLSIHFYNKIAISVWFIHRHSFEKTLTSHLPISSIFSVSHLY